MKKLLVISLALTLGSCCTLVNGKHDDVRVNSNVTSATVKVDGVVKGVTPCTIEVKRKGGQVLSVEKAGYETYQARLESSCSGWVVGNILLGGIIGLGVDCITGAVVDVEPDEVNAIMQKK